jgi:hypothetical protein
MSDLGSNRKKSLVSEKMGETEMQGRIPALGTGHKIKKVEDTTSFAALVLAQMQKIADGLSKQINDTNKQMKSLATSKDIEKFAEITTQQINSFKNELKIENSEISDTEQRNGVTNQSNSHSHTECKTNTDTEVITLTQTHDHSEQTFNQTLNTQVINKERIKVDQVENVTQHLEEGITHDVTNVANNLESGYRKSITEVVTNHKLLVMHKGELLEKHSEVLRNETTLLTSENVKKDDDRAEVSDVERKQVVSHKNQSKSEPLEGAFSRTNFEIGGRKRCNKARGSRKTNKEYLKLKNRKTRKGSRTRVSKKRVDEKIIIFGKNYRFKKELMKKFFPSYKGRYKVVNKVMENEYDLDDMNKDRYI